MDNKKSFQIKKTFGVGVLMKLTKKNIPGIKIDTVGDSFVSNVSPNKLKDAVEQTLKSHNIRVKK
ncbi:MAG: hypothetical protein MI863_14135 [Desulfobacterales bacterium]|nr:hypothetical protein [Desulfobacterales bacterium]